MDIPTLAKTIATQTGVEYSLNMQNTSLQKKIQLKIGKWKLEDVMKEVQEQVGLNYKFIGDHILFTDYHPAKKQDTIVKKTKPIELKPAPVKADTPFTTRITDTISPFYSVPEYPQLSLNVGPGQVAPRSFIEAEMEIERLALQRELLFKKPRWYEPYTFAGGQINDITYLNIVAKAGLQYIYGIAGVGANLNGVRLSYGLGLRIPTETNFNSLHLEFTTGAINRHSPDSSYHGTIHERLYTFGASWSRYVGPRLFIQFEANYNLLKKVNGVYDMAYTSQESNLFKYGHLFYYMSNDYDSGKQLRSWIGTRASVFYNLSRKRTH